MLVAEDTHFKLQLTSARVWAFRECSLSIGLAEFAVVPALFHQTRRVRNSFRPELRFNSRLIVIPIVAPHMRYRCNVVLLQHQTSLLIEISYAMFACRRKC